MNPTPSPTHLVFTILYGAMTLVLVAGGVLLLLFIIRSLIGSTVMASLFGKDEETECPPREDYK
ncbi:MAG: hypothetical protein ACYC7E_07845 [Armatimonadota bacterium]